MVLYPWSQPIITEYDSALVKAAVESTWVSGGSEIEKLNVNLVKFLDTPNVALVNNGTSALMACFQSLGIEPGDEVVVPAFGFMAAANILLQMKAVPVFSDVNNKTWCIDADSIDKCVSKRTRAILITHSYGNSDNLEEILRTNQEVWKVPIIEDAAEALGSRYQGRALGTLGDFGTFSFHATKLITTGEGGAIAFRDFRLADTMKLLISHGLNRTNHYVHQLPGLNYRMPNLCAALGNAQFSRIDEFIQKRKYIDSLYRIRVSSMKNANLIAFQKLYSEEIVPWSFPIKLANFTLDKQSVAAKLLIRRGIEIRPGFRSPNNLSYMKTHIEKADFPNSISLSSTIISLPAHPSIDEKAIDDICDNLDLVMEELN